MPKKPLASGLLRLAALAFAGASPLALARTFVYVANYNTSTIGVFTEYHNGLLRPTQNIRTPGGPESIVVDKKGFVVTADSLAHAISAYRVNPATGRLTQTSIEIEGPDSNPFSLATTPHGDFLYVANSGDSTVGIYRLRARSGRLVARGAIHEAAGASPYAVALTPDGRYVYVANFDNATIGIFRRAPGHGRLQPVGDFQEPAGDGPYGLAVGPDGRFLYVADFRANVLLVLAIAKNGRLSLRDRVIEPFDHHPDSLVIDPSGRYLFTANTSANDISLFRINQANGRLTHRGHVPTGGYPFSLTLDKAARFVFAVNYGSSTISRYRLNRQDGALKAIGTTAEAADADPYSIAALTTPNPAMGAAPHAPKKSDSPRESRGDQRRGVR